VFTEDEEGLGISDLVVGLGGGRRSGGEGEGRERETKGGDW
jgi:hypothetical protein